MGICSSKEEKTQEKAQEDDIDVSQMEEGSVCTVAELELELIRYLLRLETSK
jgi:hypothetical protein